jgi:hypothetical protein
MPAEYVIVGRGYSALLNHLTMRAVDHRRLHAEDDKNKRVLSVLHLGKPDPWSKYGTLGMGQWPCLLKLPGYQAFEKVTGKVPAKDQWLTSDYFASSNAQVASDLAMNGTAFDGHHVTDVCADGSAFVLKLDDNFEITASKVDVCTGPGTPRFLEDKQIDAILQKELANTTLPRSRKRLLHAQDFLDVGTNVVSGEHICISGGGGTGAWCVERAVNSGAKVTWVQRDQASIGLPASGRNDPLFQHFDRSDSKRLIPRNTALRLAEEYVVSYVSSANGGVQVKFGEATSRNGQQPSRRFVDCNGHDLGNPDGAFSRLVVSHGFENALVDRLHKKGLVNRLVVEEGLPVCLESSNGNLRVLGFAATNPFIAKAADEQSSLQHYVKSLPQQCSELTSIACSTVLIGLANGYFSSLHPNGNVNTATLADIFRLFRDAGGTRNFATSRGMSIDPLTDLPTGIPGQVQYP